MEICEKNEKRNVKFIEFLFYTINLIQNLEIIVLTKKNSYI